MTDKHPAIACHHVAFSYGKEEVIRDMSFTINEGDYVGIIGQNGAGKSTLIKLLINILKPDKGEIEIFGTPIQKFIAWDTIGYVPQHTPLLTHAMPITVEEAVATGRTTRRTYLHSRTAADTHAISNALDHAGIADIRHRTLQSLSGGQKQRVVIARALAEEPRLLILDEPVVGIDPEMQHAFYQLLQKIRTQRPITLILVSHDLDVVMHEADYIMCLNQGALCHDTTAELERMKKHYITI